MPKTILTLILSVLFSNLAQATVYTELLKRFQSAKVPDTDSIRGYWVGRCFSSADQDFPRASIYTFRELNGSTKFDTQSYFVDFLAKHNKYDKLSSSEIENDPSIAGWLTHETWDAIEIKKNSLSTTHSSESGDEIRSVRFYQNGNVSYLLLHSADTSAPNWAMSICYYSHFASNNPNPNPNPTPHLAYVYANTGTLKSGGVMLTSPQPTEMVNRLVFMQTGEQKITLKSLRIETDGATLGNEQPLVLIPNVPYEFIIGTTGMKIHSMTFDLEGTTQNLKIEAVREPIP